MSVDALYTCGLIFGSTVFVMSCLSWCGRKRAAVQPTAKPPGNKVFTREELKECKGENGKPLYVAVCGKVYDVSTGSGFYGPGGPYHYITGRDASRILATMDMDGSDPNEDISDLTVDQQESLQTWVAKYDSKYPVVGTLLGKPGNKTFTRAELSECKGENGKPLYVALAGTVYDVAAGIDFYGPGGPYHYITGRDAARILATMDMDGADPNEDVSNLSSDEQMSLENWVTKYNSKYPIVGHLKKEEDASAAAPEELKKDK